MDYLKRIDEIIFKKICIFLSSLVSKEHICVKEGESALMVWGRTSGGEELRGNRLVVNLQVIAYLPRNSLNMSCSPFIKIQVWRNSATRD